jgi:hypothetical protein
MIVPEKSSLREGGGSCRNGLQFEEEEEESIKKASVIEKGIEVCIG